MDITGFKFFKDVLNKVSLEEKSAKEFILEEGIIPPFSPK